MTRPSASGGHISPDGYYEGPPPEDQFDKARRQAKELVKASDEIMEHARREDARKAEYAAVRPRAAALTAMAWHRLVLDHHGTPGKASAAVRRAALARDPVFRSLPEPARRIWDAEVDKVTEWVHEGSGELARLRIHELAGTMASSEAFATWDPPADDFDTAADLAAIPRG